MPVDTVESVALTQAPAQTQAADMLERLARDPAVGVDKLERLIAMQERILRFNAEAAFNAALAQMQPKIPTVGERSKTDKTTYAAREDIVDVVRPILSQFGFSLSFRTEWPDKGTVRVVGILTHQDGHSRTSEFLSSADKTGSKNDIQALGSAVEYGRRYTTTDLLNIVTRKADDDGARTQQPKAPDGFEDWLLDLEAVAAEGTARLEATWKASSQALRAHLTKTNNRKWNDLKATAAKVSA